MRMCVYVCVHVRVSACVCVENSEIQSGKHIYMCLFVHTYMRMGVRVCVYARVHVSARASVCECVCVYMRECVYAWVSVSECVCVGAC